MPKTGKSRNPLVVFIVILLISFLPGILGSSVTFSSINSWYVTLNKPFFTPPNWLFGPAWSVLYILMGISAYLVYQKGIKNAKVRQGLIIYGIQLVFNGLWSFLFFGLRSPFLGLFGIAILWLLIVWTIFKFSKVSKTAAIILIPYLLWVSFASLLNYYTYILN